MQESPPTAGDRLLSFFDSNPVIAGEKLLRCRQKLIRRFGAERCRDPEDLANETLQRVLDALNKNPQRLTTKVEAFISGFATNIIYESRRSSIYKEDPLDDISPAHEPRTKPLDELLIACSEQEELRLCLKKCLDELLASERETLIRYYDTEHGDKLKEVRGRMALSLGFTSSQLRKRAFNLRTKLGTAIKTCLGLRNKTQELS
jgi:DNA-directed RNA polymerase specialized sigma24 family protein